MTRSALTLARAPVCRSTTTMPYGGERPATKPLTTACKPPDSVGGNAVGGWVVEDVDDVADVEDVVEVSGASTVVVVLAGAVVVVAGRATGAPARPQLTASTSTTTAPRAITPCDGT